MERLLARSLATVTVVVAVLALVAAVNANTTHMAQLPAPAKFGCANCHVNATAQTAPSNGELNSFGRAFKNNGNVWDATLAAKDSDGDGCQNGIELGDVDGNGVLDPHQTDQTSNPGVSGDCQPSTLDETTWGALKSLFNSSK